MVRDVQVLMATYNAGAYLDEQLVSLRAQTVASRIALVVRDDGSTDDTLERLRAFPPGDLEIEVLAGENVGVVGSFLALMRAADHRCAYSFLCDQDDVWDVDKVEYGVRALAPFADAPEPVLYCGRSIVTREDLSPLGPTDDATRGPSFHNALTQNVAPGHTMAMNRALLRLARDTLDPTAVVMHDCWLYLLAAGLGRVVFDSVPHARYRLHGRNDTGYAVGRRQRAVRAVQRLFTLDRRQWTRQARALAGVADASLSAADRALLSAFLDQRSLRARWRYLRGPGLLYQRARLPVAASLLFLIGRYRDV